MEKSFKLSSRLDGDAMSNKEFEENVSKIMCLVKEEAFRLRENDGYGGRMDASILETQVRFFQFGWAQTIPPEWKKFEKQVIKSNDPEWKEYQRLKTKFEKEGK